MIFNEIYFEVKQNRVMKLIEKKLIVKKVRVKFIVSYKSFYCDVMEMLLQLCLLVR